MTDWTKTWDVSYLSLGAAVILWKIFRKAFLRYAAKRDGPAQSAAGMARSPILGGLIQGRDRHPAPADGRSYG